MAEAKPKFAVEGSMIGMCPGQCGRAIRWGVRIVGDEMARVMFHADPSCQYFKDNDIETILSDSVKIAKA